MRFEQIGLERQWRVRNAGSPLRSARASSSVAPTLLCASADIGLERRGALVGTRAPAPSRPCARSASTETHVRLDIVAVEGDRAWRTARRLRRAPERRQRQPEIVVVLRRRRAAREAWPIRLDRGSRAVRAGARRCRAGAGNRRDRDRRRGSAGRCARPPRAGPLRCWLIAAASSWSGRLLANLVSSKPLARLLVQTFCQVIRRTLILPSIGSCDCGVERIRRLPSSLKCRFCTPPVKL